MKSMLLVSLAAASAGCSAQPSDDHSGVNDSVANIDASSLLDVNDVSVLFPFDSQAQALSPDLPLDSFISKNVFDQVIAASKTVNISHKDPLGSDVYANWRIVSFRFDPCAPSTALASGSIPADLQGKVPGCIVQLRLIAQPIAERGPGAPVPGGAFNFNPITPAHFPAGVKVPQDFAAHLVFNLGVLAGSANTDTLRSNFASFMPLVNGLQGLKELSSKVGAGTNGALMGVHPGLKKELSAGTRELSDAVATYLKTFLKPERLSLVAFMGIPERAFVPWIFLTGSVRPGADGQQVFTHNALSGFSRTTMSSAIPALQSTIGEPVFFPDQPIKQLSAAALYHPRTSQKDAVKGAFEIENPDLNHALNTDCASCHSMHGIKAGAAGTGGVRQISDLPPTRFIQQPGVTSYMSTEVTGSLWNVHNLGYLGIEPKVAERTLAETGAVVDLVNRLIAGDGRQNPGLDCGSDRAKLDEIYFCQFKAKTPDAQQACFASCTVRGTNP
jgi:hypothetical protein